LIVLKFGGSSIDSPPAFAAIAERVRERLALQPVVVVSAMARTTRRLQEAATLAAAGDLEAALSILAVVEAFHHDIGSAVTPADRQSAIESVLERSFVPLRALVERLSRVRVLSSADQDAATSWGEILASEILALALPRYGLPAEWVDCRRVIVTDNCFTRARPDEARTTACLRQSMLPILERGVTPVVGGYVGATIDGATTTLGKEGSDFSAALVGAGLGAEEIQIWTDVDGILTADPRVVLGARRLRSLSFAEALELACSGAKKPHPGTLGPAGRMNVPIRILNTRNPTGQGTLIGRRAEATSSIKSIASRGHAYRALVPVVDEGNVSRALAVAEELRPAVLVTGIDQSGVELAIEREDRLAEILQAFESVGPVELLPGQATLSLVSEDLVTDPDLLARALEAAAEWKPRLVTRGAFAPVVRGWVDEADAATAVGIVHERLFSKDDEAIS
jgi:aspartate kinase